MISQENKKFKFRLKFFVLKHTIQHNTYNASNQNKKAGKSEIQFFSKLVGKSLRFKKSLEG